MILVPTAGTVLHHTYPGTVLSSRAPNKYTISRFLLASLGDSDILATLHTVRITTPGQKLPEINYACFLPIYYANHDHN